MMETTMMVTTMMETTMTETAMMETTMKETTTVSDIDMLESELDTFADVHGRRSDESMLDYEEETDESNDSKSDETSTKMPETDDKNESSDEGTAKDLSQPLRENFAVRKSVSYFMLCSLVSFLTILL